MKPGAHREPYRSPTLRIFRYVWDFKLTSQGKLLVGAGLAGGFLGASALDIPVYPLFLCLFWLGVIATLVNMLYRPRLDVSVTLPERVVAGQAFEAEAVIKNTGRWTAYDCAAGFLQLPWSMKETGAERYVRTLPAGQTAKTLLRILPKRRGVYDLPKLRAFTTFPFHLLRSGRTKRSVGALLVQPSFSPLTEVRMPVSRRYQPGGIALTSNIGESPEYIGNREFRPGDPIKHIDFRSWARLAKPAVREYQEEYYCRLALVVDTHVPLGRWKGPRGYSDFESGLSLTASVADALSRGEYLIDIFAAGPEVYVFRAGRHTAHLDNILEILACVDPCRKNPFQAVNARLAGELQGISSLIGIFLDWDEPRCDLMRMAEEAGCEAKALIVRKNPPSKPLDYGGLRDIQRFTPEAIQSGGVDVV